MNQLRWSAYPRVSWVHWMPTPQGLALRCTVCGATGGALSEQEAHAFAAHHREHVSASPEHYGAGDMVARATKALGMETCTPCEKRRRMLNQMMPRVWRR